MLVLEHSSAETWLDPFSLAAFNQIPIAPSIEVERPLRSNASFFLRQLNCLMRHCVVQQDLLFDDLESHAACVGREGGIKWSLWHCCTSAERAATAKMLVAANAAAAKMLAAANAAAAKMLAAAVATATEMRAAACGTLTNGCWSLRRNC